MAICLKGMVWILLSIFSVIPFHSWSTSEHIWAHPSTSGHIRVHPSTFEFCSPDFPCRRIAQSQVAEIRDQECCCRSRMCAHMRTEIFQYCVLQMILTFINYSLDEQNAFQNPGSCIAFLRVFLVWLRMGSKFLNIASWINNVRLEWSAYLPGGVGKRFVSRFQAMATIIDLLSQKSKICWPHLSSNRKIRLVTHRTQYHLIRLPFLNNFSSEFQQNLFVPFHLNASYKNLFNWSRKISILFYATVQNILKFVSAKYCRLSSIWINIINMKIYLYKCHLLLLGTESFILINC